MNIELLKNIIEELETTRPRQAKKLKQLLGDYNSAGNETKKRKAKKAIKDTLYNLFINSLTTMSRYAIYDLGIVIGEGCYGIEYAEGNDWHVGYVGAVRMVYEDGNYEVKNFIPRNYKEGFSLDIPEDMDIVEKAKAIEFYRNQMNNLDHLSEQMDRRQEMLENYELKAGSMKRETAEKIISYLDMPRIGSLEDIKQETRQKVRA